MRGCAHLVTLHTFRLLFNYNRMIREVHKVFDQTLALGAHNILRIEVYLLVLFIFNVFLEQLFMILPHEFHLD